MAIENIEKKLIGKETIDVGDKLGSFHESFEDPHKKALDGKSALATIAEHPRTLGAIAKTSKVLASVNDFKNGKKDGIEAIISAGKTFSGAVGFLAADTEGEKIATEIYEIGIDGLCQNDSSENIQARIENVKNEIKEQSGEGEIVVSAFKAAVNSYDELLDWYEGNQNGAETLYKIGEHVASSTGEFLGGEEWATEAVVIYEEVVEQGGEIIESIGEAAGEIADNIAEAASNIADGVSEKLDAAADKASEVTNAAKAKIASIFD